MQRHLVTKGREIFEPKYNEFHLICHKRYVCGIMQQLTTYFAKKCILGLYLYMGIEERWPEDKCKREKNKCCLLHMRGQRRQKSSKGLGQRVWG